MRPYLTKADLPTPPWTKLEFSNDGKHILLASNSSSGHLLLDAFYGNLVAHCPRGPGNLAGLRPAPGQPGQLGQGDACFSADGRYLLGGGGGDRDAVVWDAQGQVEVETKQLKPMCTLPCKGPTRVVEWNPRYNMMASADREVIFWLPDEHVGMVKMPS